MPGLAIGPPDEAIIPHVEATAGAEISAPCAGPRDEDDRWPARWRAGAFPDRRQRRLDLDAAGIRRAE